MHLFSKENIWLNPHSCNNNSVDRIISKEEEREDPRRDSSIYLRVQWCFHISTRTTVFTHNPASFQSSRAILHTELILLQEFSKKYYNYKAHPVQAPSSNCPHVSKHSTRQNKAPGSLTAFQGHTAQAGFQLILPGRNSILSGSQHPRTPYSSSQASSTLQNSTRRNRILSKRVKYCMSMQY